MSLECKPMVSGMCRAGFCGECKRQNEAKVRNGHTTWCTHDCHAETAATSGTDQETLNP